MLCLADRSFFGYALWQAAVETGADLLWRVKGNLRLPRETVLPDGSYLSTIYPSEADRRRRTGGLQVGVAELKTQLRGARVVLRSKTPALVRQEVWGLLLAHFAVRGLMHEAALQADEDPDRLSFSHAVRVVRRKIPHFAALSPS